MSTHEKHPPARRLQQDESDIIKQLVDVYGIEETEAQEMWQDFKRTKLKANRPKRSPKGERRDWRARKR